MADKPKKNKYKQEDRGESDCCSNNNNQSEGHDKTSRIKLFTPAIISLILLGLGLVFDHWKAPEWYTKYVRLTLYIIAYLPVGLPVLYDAFKSIRKGDVFSEFLLMSIATLGAFAIGVYPEGVAVMLFYTVGELFQHFSVNKAKSNIQSLLDQRPDKVTVIEDGVAKEIKAEDVEVDSTIQLKPGEKLGLDGELLTDNATFNTSALTGESVPEEKTKGETVLAGMLNLKKVTQVRVTAAYTDSKLSRILELTQNAAHHKAPTELFIRKFSKIYTPIVVALAVGLCFIPYFFLENYVFQDWLYRALIFLVISCPCALVISIPLGYFGGIGAASRNGILVKGGNFLDALAKMGIIVFDKTGTLTEGVFKVQEVTFNSKFNQEKILKMVNVLEQQSSHPIASAIHDYLGSIDKTIELKETEEIAGLGLRSKVDGKELLVGNFNMMEEYNISRDVDPQEIDSTTIAVAYDKQFAGYITVADKIKEEASTVIEDLKAMKVNSILLSGDKATVVNAVADTLNIKSAFGELLPEDKYNKVKEIKTKNDTVSFVGDGVNDAPVIALSDVGIAMGGMGSDATIESADVVIQDDNLSKIPQAIKIGKKTKRIVWQNILLALGVKGIVLLIGAFGIATMWEAVFADVGVALLAVLNAVRIQKMEF